MELARAVCERLTITCTVQARRFDTLLDALADKQGDVVAAAIPLTAGLRARFLATRPYFRWPARFISRRDRNLPAASATALAGRSIGVVEGSAHEAYLKAYFPKATRKTFTELSAPTRRRPAPSSSASTRCAPAACGRAGATLPPPTR